MLIEIVDDLRRALHNLTFVEQHRNGGFGGMTAHGAHMKSGQQRHSFERNPFEVECPASFLAVVGMGEFKQLHGRTGNTVGIREN